MNNEVWVPIPNLEPYHASNFGRIARIIPDKEHLVIRTIIKKGYEHIGLSVNKKRKSYLVHRLVAMAFIGMPPLPKAEINHLDGNKQNNIPGNLEWTTRSENLKHYYTTLNGMEKRPRGIKQWQAKFTDDDVRLIRKLVADGISYNRISDFVGKNVTTNNICNIMKRRTYKHVSD